MAAKKGWSSKKKVAKVEEPKVEEKVEPIEETPVNTDIEKEIEKVEEVKMENVPVRGEIVGNGTATTVTKPRGTIRFEAQVSAVPMFKLPPDIKQYLINKGFGTNVWRRDKERLEKHGADMEMIEKLKKFLTGNL